MMERPLDDADMTLNDPQMTCGMYFVNVFHSAIKDIFSQLKRFVCRNNESMVCVHRQVVRKKCRIQSSRERGL